MPQFAVNSQLATRNPEPAVLLSPQGRVGTTPSLQRKILDIGSPSPQGRVGTPLWGEGGILVERSPSPQGRVGTSQQSSRLNRGGCCRRPLKVGSGLSLPKFTAETMMYRRPLKVGSGHTCFHCCRRARPQSPSPQGRVGTQQPKLHQIQDAIVAVPSRSGRDSLCPSQETHPSTCRRPLKVGSGPAERILCPECLSSRRPLKVGSGLGCG